jgi:hypothetical protein
MTDIGLNHSLQTNANVENEHAHAAAGAASDGGMHASDAGAAYDGSGGVDASGSANLPDPPGLPDAGLPETGLPDTGLPDVTGDLPVGADAVGGVPDLSGAAVDGTLGGAASATTDGASLSWDGMLDGWLDVVGELVAQFSGSVTALFGF